MKFLAVVTPPSIYHGCSAWKTFWEGKFTGKKYLFQSVNMKIVIFEEQENNVVLNENSVEGNKTMYK